jgi:hypothetical protein
MLLLVLLVLLVLAIYIGAMRLTRDACCSAARVRDHAVNP